MFSIQDPRTRRRFLGLVLTFVAALPSVAAAQATFEVLPFDPTLQVFRRQRMLDVSADGATVGGTLLDMDDFFTRQAGRWDAGLGASPVGTSADHVANQPFAFGVSGDGTTLVGTSDADGFIGGQAVLFEPDGRVTPVGSGRPGTESSALAVSFDGSIVLGNESRLFGDLDPLGAFVWDETNGARSLGALSNDDGIVVARALSDDGQVAVGFRSDSNDTPSEAFRWTESGGIETLGAPEGLDWSRALAISADGSTIVGDAGLFDAGGPTPTRAFRWTAEGGMELIPRGGFPSAGFGVTPFGVSRDGSVVVGRTDSGFQTGVIWTARFGRWIRLRDLLVAFGATGLEGWELFEVLDVSDDGRVVTGWATPPGQIESVAFRAVIPEPSTSLLLGLGLVGLGARRLPGRPGRPGRVGRPGR